ncbi:hypothetical protein DPMN_014819 [Dreissena polymorpha]|uniref:Uncharacterized protein n=1 Tax=Dreissena polymorpha TaxID=45954 RepID=A0A9D4S3V3_DREPO|nr:hypothetical protein DPMN_014819 [Dreissena polymorpha]
MDNDYGHMYQEIASGNKYDGIDNSPDGNNDHDYTNNGFGDSKKEISDNVYNHLNAGSNEYDYVGRG